MFVEATPFPCAVPHEPEPKPTLVRCWQAMQDLDVNVVDAHAIKAVLALDLSEAAPCATLLLDALRVAQAALRCERERASNAEAAMRAAREQASSARADRTRAMAQRDATVVAAVEPLFKNAETRSARAVCVATGLTVAELRPILADADVLYCGPEIQILREGEEPYFYSAR